MPASRIVKQLNALEIMPPSAYKTSRGCRGFDRHSGEGLKRSAWALTTVNAILKDEVYIGNLIQGKRKSVSYRTKKLAPAEEREWTVIDGAHEAIVSDELFAIVHDRFARHTRVSQNRQTEHLLSGYVKCARCGGRMNRNVSHGVARFRCMTRIYAPEQCRCPSIREAALEAEILKAIQEQVQELVDAEAVLEAARRNRPENCTAKKYRSAMKRAEWEKQRLEEAKFRLYDNFEKGVIDQDEYASFKKRYNAGIAEQESFLEGLRKQMADLKESRRQDGEFVSYFEKYGSMAALDREVLERLLDYVAVEDGSHVHVYFKFSPAPEKALDHGAGEPAG